MEHVRYTWHGLKKAGHQVRMLMREQRDVLF
jgi:hypothetical protein